MKVSSAAAAAAFVGLMAASWAPTMTMIDALDSVRGGSQRRHHNSRFKMGLLSRRLSFVSPSRNVNGTGGGDGGNASINDSAMHHQTKPASHVQATAIVSDDVGQAMDSRSHILVRVRHDNKTENESNIECNKIENHLQ